MTAELSLEFGFIQAPKMFEKNITDEFIDENKCKSFKTNQTGIYGRKLIGTDEYIYYVCDKDYEINKNLSFINKEFGYVFELDKNDLFLEYGDKKYFNIIFNNGYLMKNWIFGKPLFLKYQWVFDPDKKTLGIYYKKENSNSEDDNTEKGHKNMLLIFILIISVFAFLVVLFIFIYQIFIKKGRKLRNNELSEEFDYSGK